jgi:hypothetical protein
MAAQINLFCITVAIMLNDRQAAPIGGSSRACHPTADHAPRSAAAGGDPSNRSRWTARMGARDFRWTLWSTRTRRTSTLMTGRLCPGVALRSRVGACSVWTVAVHACDRRVSCRMSIFSDAELAYLANG